MNGMGARSVTSGSQTSKGAWRIPGITAALLVSGLLLAQPVRAERSVGLDAQGVDPLAALHNDQGLDVRDALGRPVSGEKVSSELSQASAKRATTAAYASALPKAKLFAALLEFCLAAEMALRSPWHSFSLPSVAVHLPRRSQSSLGFLVFLLLVLSVSARRRLERACVPASRRSSQKSVLRC
jgi:hypothetical protein